MNVPEVTLDKPGEPLGTQELGKALRYRTYLEHLPTCTEVERELLTRDPRQLRAIIVDLMGGRKQRQLDPDTYARWSRIERLDG